MRASPECRDLLHRILVADPAVRISLADIQRHPWFLAELPEGCQDMNARLLEEPPEPEVQVLKWTAPETPNPNLTTARTQMRACWRAPGARSAGAEADQNRKPSTLNFELIASQPMHTTQ